MEWLNLENGAYLIAIILGGLATMVATKWRMVVKELIEDMKGACSDWRKASELGDEDSAKWLRNQC